MTPKQRTFGERLREKRIEKGFSLRRFAQRVGVSPTYLSQVEDDPRPPGKFQSCERPAACWTGGACVARMAGGFRAIPTQLRSPTPCRI